MSVLLTAPANHEHPPTSAIMESKSDKGDDKDGDVLARVQSAGHAELVHRRLNARQIQLISLAGTVGAALFVAIGRSLAIGGPLNLLIAVILWVGVIFCVSHCQAETVSTFPVDGSFISLADRFVSEAYGAMTGYNFLIFQAALICFEINIFGVVIGYWAPNLNPAILISVLIFVYFCINIWSVSWFGEAEFWLALGKLILIISMLFFTLITMCGGNPQKDAYGFRFWKNPGAMNDSGNGALGRFEGFLACLINAAFLVAGPEYVSMVAGESCNPRKTMPRAFTSIIYRLTAFFILGALAVGIVVPYTDPGLLRGGGPTAAASPYVLGMNRLGITILPDIVNALIATSIFSSANAYMYGTSRSLFSLAQRGQAPRIFTRVNRHGNPYMAVIATSAISALSYLSVSQGTAKVLNWWISLVTAGQLMNWLIMATTWIRFNAGMKAQNIPRSFLAYRSPLQPYAAWIALIGATLVLGISGYTLFKPGQFATDQFIFAYGQCFLDAIIYLGFCAYYRQFRWRKATQMDFNTGLDVLEAYELEYKEAQDLKKRHVGHRLSGWIFD